MSALAVEHEAINLGQGYPDTDGPTDIRRVAADALSEGSNQYPPMLGSQLHQATADHNNRLYDLGIDWQTGTMVSCGATEAIAASIFGIIEPGDEAVMIEPLYDCYLPLLERAGGIWRCAWSRLDGIYHMINWNRPFRQKPNFWC